MRDYRKYEVFSKAHSACLRVYLVSRNLPNHELYGLTSQLRRAAMSVPTNIAEGAGRRTDKDFARFLDIAAGSCNEVEYLTLLASDLTYIGREDASEIQKMYAEVRRMLVGLRDKLLAVSDAP